MATVTWDYGFSLDPAAFTADPDPLDFVVYQEASADISYEYPAGTTPDSPYWFGVRKRVGNSVSGWTKALYTKLALPAVPTLSSPAAATYTDDTTPTFDWTEPTPSVISNSGTLTFTGGFGGNAGMNSGLYQSFTPAANGRVRKITVNLGAQVGNGLGSDAEWTIHEDNAGDLGALVTSGTFTPTPSALNTITIDAFHSLTNGAVYWLGLRMVTPNLDGANNLLIWEGTDNSYAGGQMKARLGEAALIDLWGTTYDGRFSVELLTTTDVQVDTWDFQLTSAADTGFATPILNVTGITASTYTPAAQPDGNYLWRVRAVNASGASAWTTARSLHLQQLTAAIGLLTPIVDRAVDQYRLGIGSTNKASFTWTADALADTYDFQFSPNADMSAPIINATGIVTTNYAPVWSPNPPTVGDYYWRVRGVNETGNGAWSSIRKVVVKPHAWEMLAAYTGYRVAWWAKDADSLLWRATNPYVSEGRDIALNGNMSSSTGWSVGANWSIAGGVATHTPGSTAAIGNNVTTAGKAYKITYDLVVNAGTITITGGSGGARSATGSYTDYVIATGTSIVHTPNSAFDGTLDNVVIKQVNIRASTDYPSATGRLNIVSNGQFEFDYGAVGTNWAIVGGVLVHTPGSAVVVTLTGTPVIGKSYDIIFDVIGRTTGSITPLIGSTGAGSAVTANGTNITQTIVAAGSSVIRFDPSSVFDGSIDNVRVVPTDSLLVFNGDGSTTTGWTAQNSATLSSTGGRLRVTCTGVASAGASQANVILGRRYRLTAKAYGDGSANPIIVNSASLFTGTASASQQNVDVVFIAASTSVILRANTSTNTQFCEFDDISIVEINPLDMSISGAVQSSGKPDALGAYALTFDVVNDVAFIGGSELNSIISWAQEWQIAVFDPDLATLTDGLNNYLHRLIVTATLNEIRVLQAGASNLFQSNYYGNSATPEIVSDGGHSLSVPEMMDIAYDTALAGGTLQMGFNGLPVNSSTGFSELVGNLAGNGLTVGASSVGGANPFGGDYYMLALVNAYPTDAQRLELAQVMEVD